MTKVLVVDDSPVDRRLAGGLLEKNRQIEVDYASNGREALERTAASNPDIVVTDLEMPELNGLDLVSAIRSRFPLVPVILMTGQGSEEVAVAALESGASSYVSKSFLARDLLDTVENVLAVARADRRHERLMDCLVSSRSSFTLTNDPGLVPPLVDLLQEQVSRMRLTDETGRIRFGVALEEALLNALYHGNLNLKTEELREASGSLIESEEKNIIERRRTEAPYRDRKIHVIATVSPAEAVVVIRDEGSGFDYRSLSDPTEGTAIERQTGRGLVLMQTFMDDVRFNAAGNEVTLVKRRES